MRIALAQTKPRLGDISANCQTILNILNQYGNLCELIVFPEMALLGYYVQDLLFDRSLLAEHQQAVSVIQSATASISSAIILGSIESHGFDGTLFNSACCLANGKQMAVYHKHQLASQTIFYESRYFSSGQQPLVWPWKDHRLAIFICEDIWPATWFHPHQASWWDKLSEAAPTCAIVLNASPHYQNKWNTRLSVASKRCQQLNLPMIYINQVGGQDELVFDGGSMVLDQHGHLQANLPRFQPAVGICHINQPVSTWQGPWCPPKLVDPYQDIFDHLLLGLSDFFNHTGCSAVVVGLSGGMDSAMVAALATLALGPNKVHACYLPSRFNHSSSAQDAEALAKRLGISYRIASIDDEYAFLLQNWEQQFGLQAKPIVKQNVQARIRAIKLMALSNQHHWLLLATGNKSELAVGYSTLYGDMAGGFNPIGDLYKTEIYQLATWINQHRWPGLFHDHLLSRPPSAELAPDQRDSDDLPPYPILDTILKKIIDYRDLTATEQSQLDDQMKAIPAELYQQIATKVASAEFKRRQSPPILKIARCSFGQGRMMPLASRCGTRMMEQSMNEGWRNDL